MRPPLPLLPSTSPLLSLLLRLLLPLAIFPPTSYSAPTNPSQATLLPPHPHTSATTQGFKIPTRHESTVLARRLLALSATAVISTVFPDDDDDSSSSSSSSPSSFSSPPSGLASVPIALPEYIATCEETTHPGDPTILALDVSTTTRNARAGSNVSLSVSWWDAYKDVRGREPWSRASLPRMSLLGYLEEIVPGASEMEGDGDGEDVGVETKQKQKQKEIAQCFTKVHGDSRLWLPGDKGAAHSGRWMRVVVREVYWVGGFGDRAFIGWFEAEEWKGVKSGEWEGVRLPGEEGGN